LKKETSILFLSLVLFSLTLLLSLTCCFTLSALPSQNWRKEFSSEQNGRWIFFGTTRFRHCKWKSLPILFYS
jgi:hypothetical protein